MKQSTQKRMPSLSMGDLVDRLSILIRKISFGEEDAYKEHQYLIKGLNDAGYPGDLIALAIKLSQSNIDIWNLENDIRKLADPVDKLGLEEIGRRAMRIRDNNRKRIRYKNDINKLTGEGFTEFKIKHRSQ